MKLLGKRSTALVLAVIMIALAVGLGQWKARRSQPPVDTGTETGLELDTSLPAQAYTNWLWDEAQVLSDETEHWLCLYNANWDQRYGSLVAVAAVSSVEGNLEEYAYSLGNEIGLGQSDALLVMDIAGQDCWLATGNQFDTMLSGSQISAYLDQYLADDFFAGKYDDGVLKLFSALNEKYYSDFGAGQGADPSGYESRSTVSILAWTLTLLIVLILLFTIVDSMRYSAYHRKYYGMATPPVIFRPILFWHGPGYGWYRRRWNRPPPPPPPPGGGPRGPGGFGGSSRGGGFGGSRGGGFGRR